MFKTSVQFGGKKGKQAWNLVESSHLLAIRTQARQPLQRVPFVHKAHHAIKNYECVFATHSAGVQVLDVKARTERDALRKSLPGEDSIQFAGRVLMSADSGLPVLYTENLFVKLAAHLDSKDCRAILEKYNLVDARLLPFAPNAYFVRAQEGIGLKIFDLPDQLFSENEVELCHPELVTKRSTKAANPNQWHLKRAQINGKDINQHASVEDAWAQSVGTGITIAIIDTGCDYTHEEFSSPGKVVSPRDVTLGNDDPRPGFGENHGTACAGVACADGIGTPGASGVAPGAKLMPIRLASDLGSVEEAEAFYYAAKNKADVISCSWGPTDGDPFDPSDPMHSFKVPMPDSTRLAIEYCINEGRDKKGCVITWAAGNGNESADNDGYASFDKVIAVAACNDRGKKSDYSDFGKCIWCAFPSSQLTNPLTPGIFTVDRSGSAGYNQGSAGLGDPAGNYTNDFGGTSSACPGVAGVAALVLSVKPDLRADQVKQILADTADKIDKTGGAYDANGHSRFFGFGRINAKKAVAKAISMGGMAKPASQPKTLRPTVTVPAPSRENDIVASYLALLHRQEANLASLIALARGGAADLSQALSARVGREGGTTRKLTRDEMASIVISVFEHVPHHGPVTESTTLASFGVDDIVFGHVGNQIRNDVRDAGSKLKTLNPSAFANFDSVGDVIDACTDDQ